jgi:hypothetical protein
LKRRSKGIGWISGTQVPLMMLLVVLLVKMGFWWLYVFGIAIFQADVNGAL